MDIRNSLDGLKSLLGVASPAPASTQSKSGAAAAGSDLSSDRATLSSAGSEASMATSEPSVRTDKVALVQAALAAGTYEISPSAVASKVVDAMLNGDR